MGVGEGGVLVVGLIVATKSVVGVSTNPPTLSIGIITYKILVVSLCGCVIVTPYQLPQPLNLFTLRTDKQTRPARPYHENCKQNYQQNHYLPY